jgi:hypothetical protein
MNCPPNIPSLRNFTALLAAGFTILCSFHAKAQEIAVPDDKPASYTLRAHVIDKDTMPVVDLNTVYVYTDFIYKNKKQYEQWTRVKHNVKKVYPYAIVAAAKLKEYDRVLEKMPTERLKKEYLSLCEKDLKNEFEDELKNLSVNQGRVLMKLIDRETGKTTYEVVKQMRGSFQAVMWQTVARIFGNNMKDDYDAVGEDIMIERAIKLVESGQF